MFDRKREQQAAREHSSKLAMRSAGRNRRSETRDISAQAAGNQQLQRLLERRVIQPKLKVSRSSDQYEQKGNTEPRASSPNGRKSPRVMPHAGGDNRSILRKIESGQLKVSQPGDKYEQEADRVAEAIMRMPESAPSRSAQEVVPAARIQRMCPRCQKRHRRGKPLNCPECEEELQRKAGGAGSLSTDNQVESAAQWSRRNGRPLPNSVRAFFEPRFGSDFSSVRIHTDNESARSAEALNARAYTVGHDIFFASGEYAPSSKKGQRLLAHELTHTIQQPSASRQREVQRSPDGDCPPQIEVEPNHAGECDEIERESQELQTFESGGPQLEEMARCTVISNMASGRANFDAGKVRDFLQGVAQLAMSSDNALIVITGYTDCITQTGPQVNRNLRIRRAYKVAVFMMNEFGVPAEKIRFEGAALTEYIASNSTPEGRARNRAVSISIVTTDEQGEQIYEQRERECYPALRAYIKRIFRHALIITHPEIILANIVLGQLNRKITHVATGIRLSASVSEAFGFGGGGDLVMVTNLDSGLISFELCAFGELFVGPGIGAGPAALMAFRISREDQTGRGRFCGGGSVGISGAYGIGAGASISFSFFSEGTGWIVGTADLGEADLQGSMSGSVSLAEAGPCQVLEVLIQLSNEIRDVYEDLGRGLKRIF